MWTGKEFHIFTAEIRKARESIDINNKISKYLRNTQTRNKQMMIMRIITVTQTTMTMIISVESMHSRKQHH